MNKKITLLAPTLLCLLTGCVGTKNYPLSDYMMSVKWNDTSKDFRILQLADIHFSNMDDLDQHFRVLDSTITKANADLIVLNGDIFTYASKKVVQLLFGFIDSYDIPWTFTYGNHDDQGYFNDLYIQRLLSDQKTYKNVKFINLEDDNVTGRSNFAINIKKEGQTVYQVYCLDSHSYNFDHFGYDFIKQDQIDWYKNMVNYSTELNGKVMPSSLYFHIPLPEFLTAWNESATNPSSVIIGKNDEGTGSPAESYDSKFFDVVKELGSSISISCAHDHLNDSVIDYQGVKLCYDVKATDRIYFAPDMIGGQVTIVSKDDQRNLSFENIFTTYEEVK